MSTLNQEKLEALIINAVREALLKKNGQETKKPETMTHLNGSELVKKTHPAIAFRGQIDSLESEIILVQLKAGEKGLLSLSRDLEEIRKFVHSLIRFEITGERLTNIRLLNMDMETIHEYSHHPSKYFGMSHYIPTAAQGEIPALLNRLRTSARETELCACRAFLSGDEESFERSDIIMALNRLSSLFHIMSFKYLSGGYRDMEVAVEASGRHIHLCREDVDRLFGGGYKLHKVRDLSQPGQYVCRERLSIEGPKGRIDNVVVLGPEREKTQVEISVTDARTLGVEAVIRQSGDIKGTPGATLIKTEALPEKSKDGRTSHMDIHGIYIDEGVIVAKRHIHLHTSTAGRWRLKDGDIVCLKIGGERETVFNEVVVRVSDKFADFAHIDYDEANACLFKKGTAGLIVKT